MADDPNALVRGAMPLARTLDMRASEASPASVVLHLDWSDDLCTSGGLLHGGAVMALADSAGATCAFLNLPEGAAGTTTIESKTNFFSGVPGGTITATTSPLHVGRTTIVVETDVVRDDGRRVAKVIQTQAVLWPSGG